MWKPPNLPATKIWFLDKNGWPIERIKGRPITNFIRILLHTRKITTDWKLRSDQVSWVHGTVIWSSEEIRDAYRELREKDPIGPFSPGQFESDLGSAAQNMNMGGAASV